MANENNSNGSSSSSTGDKVVRRPKKDWVRTFYKPQQTDSTDSVDTQPKNEVSTPFTPPHPTSSANTSPTVPTTSPPPPTSSGAEMRIVTPMDHSPSFPLSSGNPDSNSVAGYIGNGMGQQPGDRASQVSSERVLPVHYQNHCDYSVDAAPLDYSIGRRSNGNGAGRSNSTGASPVYSYSYSPPRTRSATITSAELTEAQRLRYLNEAERMTLQPHMPFFPMPPGSSVPYHSSSPPAPSPSYPPNGIYGAPVHYMPTMTPPQNGAGQHITENASSSLKRERPWELQQPDEVPDVKGLNIDPGVMGSPYYEYHRRHGANGAIPMPQNMLPTIEPPNGSAFALPHCGAEQQRSCSSRSSAGSTSSDTSMYSASTSGHSGRSDRAPSPSRSVAAHQLLRLAEVEPLPSTSASCSPTQEGPVKIADNISVARSIVHSLTGPVCSPKPTLESEKKAKPETPSYLVKGTPCAVCKTDKATGNHYHAVTCEGCKGFFRRCIQKGLHEAGKLTCKNKTKKGTCLEFITKENRNSCQKCRLDKCFENGMAADLVLDDIKRIAKNKLKDRNRKMKQMKELETKQAQAAATLTVFQQNLLEYSVRALKFMEQVELDSYLVSEPRTVTAEELLQICEGDVFAKLIQPYLNLASRFCENFQENFFASCPPEEWIVPNVVEKDHVTILICERVVELMFIYVTRTYNAQDRGITFLGIRVPRAEAERLPKKTRFWFIKFYNLIENSKCTWKSNQYDDGEMAICLTKCYSTIMGTLCLFLAGGPDSAFDQISLACEQLDQLFQRKRYTPDSKPIFSFGMLPAVTFKEEFNKAIQSLQSSLNVSGKARDYPVFFTEDRWLFYSEKLNIKPIDSGIDELCA